MTSEDFSSGIAVGVVIVILMTLAFAAGVYCDVSIRRGEAEGAAGQ